MKKTNLRNEVAAQVVVDLFLSHEVFFKNMVKELVDVYLLMKSDDIKDDPGTKESVLTVLHKSQEYFQKSLQVLEKLRNNSEVSLASDKDCIASDLLKRKDDLVRGSDQLTAVLDELISTKSEEDMQTDYWMLSYLADTNEILRSIIANIKDI